MIRRVSAVACLGVLLAGVVHGEDAEAEPITVRLARGARYSVEYEESIRYTSAIGAKKQKQTSVARCTWKLDVERAPGSVGTTVPLTVRVRAVEGEFTNQLGRTTGFDSSLDPDYWGENSQPHIVKRVLGAIGVSGTVRISLHGEVVSVEGGLGGLVPAKVTGKARSQWLIAFFERFFQPLPAGRAKAGTQFTSARWIAPHTVVETMHVNAPVDERYRVKPRAGDTLTLQISGRGSKPSKDVVVESGLVKRKLAKWSVAGTATIDPTDGLARTRATKVTARSISHSGDAKVTWEYEVETKLTVTPRR
jgi:hypothetical protein